MRALIPRSLALASLLIAVVPICATPNVNVDWDCQANPPIGSSQELSLGSTIDGQAPTDVAPGSIFEVVLAAHPLSVPSQVAGYHLNNLRNVKLSVPVPPGSSFLSASQVGGANLGGTPAVSQANGVVTLSVPGPVGGGASFQFPALHLSLTATGAPGSSILTHAAGTSFSSPGLQFTANVHVSAGIDIDVPTKCFPKTSPVLTTTTVDQLGAAPLTQLAPVLANTANRTLALATATDGRIMYDWWDLGGGGHGYREVPGGLHSDAALGATLVGNGNYAFVMAKAAGSTDVLLNQGTPGGTWVGWQSLNTASNVGPAGSSCGARSVEIIVGSDGRVLYDWWDLGGGGHGLREIPGGFRSATQAAAALVDQGNYVFVLARASDGNVWINQGNPTTAVWVGWQSEKIVSNVAPAAAATGNRSIAVIITTDNRVMYDWWDLGGGGHGWLEVPGGFRTDSSAGVALVDNGRYAFVMAKDANGRMWLNQGDPTTGNWVGWE